MLQSFQGKYALRDRALFLLGLKTGFRISELLSLKVRNVCQGAQMKDRVFVARERMKGKSASRTVALHPDARQALQTWIEFAGLSEDDWLFRSQKGGPISRRQALHVLHQVYDANELTGKLGTHSMRKTFAKRVHERLGNDLLKTQKAMGHARVDSTVAYLSFNESEIDEAILDS